MDTHTSIYAPNGIGLLNCFYIITAILTHQHVILYSCAVWNNDNEYDMYGWIGILVSILALCSLFYHFAKAS